MTLLQMSFSGALLILAAAVFRTLAKKRVPTCTFLALWWAAALRLLFPVKLPSQFSIYSWMQAVRRTSLPSAPAAVLLRPATTPVQILPTLSPSETVPVPAPFPVKTAVWIAGAVLLALWFLISYVRWQRRFRESLPVSCPYVAQWLSSRSRIQVRVSDQVPAPLTYGLLRPVILLPKTMDLSDETALRCVLTHEEVHIRRLDGLLKIVLAAALCVHWFNPAAWLLYVLANRDMELRCDETVLRKLGGDSRKLYALTLIRMAENSHMPLCGFSCKNGIEERILAIMNFKKKSALTWVMALVLVGCITTVFATSAMTNGTKPTNPADDPDAALHAQSSAEAAAQWDEVLAPYVPFGLTYSFDDPDHDGNGLTMQFDGHEVRGIYDEHAGIWITEHTGNSTYGEDAVELYATYDENGMTGLRLATEEEQNAFNESREDASDEGALMELQESIHFETDVCYFTIPEREGRWNIWISGRIVTADGMGMSVHYLEEESEKGEWIPGKTYSFQETSRKVEELTMQASLNNAEATFDLLPNTEGLEVVFGSANPPMLPESKEGIPQDVEMIWPTDDGWKAAATWQNPNAGKTHDGIDIAGLEAGSPVYAAAAGTVKEAGFSGEDGNYVRLDHSNGLETFYAHCQSILVKNGDAVTLGQTIATVGSTGMSTGPHLHFEILLNGVQQNPVEYNNHDGWNTKQAIGVEELKEDAPIPAAADGTVLYTYWDWLNNNGYILAMDYGDGYESKYYACKSVSVKPGDSVKLGDTIGTSSGSVSLGIGYADAAYRAREEQELQTLADRELVNGEYRRNKKGETYASTENLAKLVGYPPDLVGAWGVNGEQGYVRLTDLCPELRTQEERDAYFNHPDYGKPATIPLYDKDGDVIGEFVIDAA